MASRTLHLARLTRLLLLGLTVSLLLPETLTGQYFGRNKVQYRTFDFRVMQTPNFDIYYYPEMEEAVQDAARMSERWYARLSRILDYQFEQRQPIILYANHPHFQQTTVLGGLIGEGTGGVTEAFQQRVIMPFAYSYEETDHILGHELVHAFQYDISGLGRAGGGIEAAARRFQVPLWFIEGMAEYLSVGPVDPLTAMWVRDAALQGNIPTIERMTRDPRVFPYRWGQALWAYVGGRWGDAAIGQILKLTGQGVPYPAAFERILNITLDELSGDWHAAIRRTYLPLVADYQEAREVARPLITGDREGGRLNIGPAVSPDGRFVAFLSELDFLDVELHMADAETGEVIRRLQKGTAFDPHFGSLRYINSAGTWSPDGQQFAFGALRAGRDVLVLLDVNRSQRLREIEIPGVGEIMNPTWSPDGQTIVVTGIAGGLANLYAVNLTTGQSRALTQDRYTALHPAFSPDGRTIAFVTEQGPGADFEQLTYGIYRLALLDLETSRVTLVPNMAGTKNTSPQWTRDGSGLYFVSNRTGIPNVYRVDIATGELAKLTNLFTGVSGITDVSPSLSVARAADRMLFTVFENGAYNIYSLTDPRELAGTPLQVTEVAGADTVAAVAAVLPPVPRPTEPAFNRVSQYLADATTGLPSSAEVAQYAIVPYRPRLGLDYLGQPQIGVGTGGAFGGGGLYGGISGIFSDVLGRHTVYGTVQAQGQLDEIGFAAAYINSRQRWNFGGLAQRIPYVLGYYGEGMLPGEGLYAQQIVRQRFFDWSLQGFAQYPFSLVQRAEFSGGLRRIAADRQIYEILYQPVGNQLLPVGERQRTEDGIGFNMFETSAALVYDNALLGWTSPFAGQRYRLQISPTFGQLQFTQALADYRRYFFARPFTLAVRGYHLGRYGRDAEANEEGQQVFRDMYLGQPWYIRGYYDAYARCREARGQSQDCQVLGQLFGSRIAVANTELRFPLVNYAVVAGGIGLPPIEGFGFVDAGIAWTSDSDPTLERGIPANPLDRGIMSSYGVGGRVNLFGYLVLELSYVNPMQRERGWHWQFNFVPGF
jgi:Tol biopolymer transport system component